MAFPTHRLRRLRQTGFLRDLVRETTLTHNDLIYPLFIRSGKKVKEEIPSMPGQFRFSVDSLKEEMKEIVDLGLKGVILFGLPEQKDAEGSQAWQKNGIVQQAIGTIKEAAPNLCVIGDVCFCQYTSHGHCGIVKGDEIVNDDTLPRLAQVAVSQVQAGADMIAPSDMMDGRVAAIRKALDEKGFSTTPIMSYAAKFSSSFYDPFRDATDGAPQFGDRKTYQMDFGNAREAIREMELDLEEGADILMIKPALSYLDLIAKAKEQFKVPIACYNVSGEYAMIKAAAQKGWLDGEKIMYEVLLSMKRAGADLILTYFAKDMARVLAA